MMPSPARWPPRKASRPSSSPTRASTARGPAHSTARPVAFRLAYGYRYTLPPQPPLTMAAIHPLLPGEIRGFSERPEWIPLVLGAPEIPADDLLSAPLGPAVPARAAARRAPSLLSTGRE